VVQHITWNFKHLDRAIVVGSDPFGLGEHIKQYLLDPDLSLANKIRIDLRYCITAQTDLILQLMVFKEYLEKKLTHSCFWRFSVKVEKSAESGNIWLPNDLCGERTFFRELMAQADPS
jgi:hypothetical protein